VPTRREIIRNQVERPGREGQPLGPADDKQRMWGDDAAVREHRVHRLEADHGLRQRLKRCRREARATADVESPPKSTGDVKVLPSRFYDAPVYGRPVVRITSRETGAIVDALRFRHGFLRDARRTCALPCRVLRPVSVLYSA